VTVAIRNSNEPLRIGAVLGAAFHAIGRNFLVMIVVAAIVIGVPDFLLASALRTYQQNPMENPHRALSMLSLLVGLGLQSLGSGALMLPVMRDREGGRAGLIETLAVFARRAPRLIAVAFLYALGLIISLMVLFIPFFFVATSWAVVPAVAAAEPVGVNGAFARGKALMQGSRTRILGVGLVALLVMGTIGFVTLIAEIIAVGEAGIGLATRALVMGAIGSTISGAFCAAVQCSLYLELRDRKDGPSEQLDAIFA
jgi:hypothetical protein